MIEERKTVSKEDESDHESRLDVREKGFEEVDCESDYEDQLDQVRAMKRRKREEAARQESRRIIPS